MGGRAQDFRYDYASGSGAWSGGAVVREREVGLPDEVDWAAKRAGADCAGDEALAGGLDSDAVLRGSAEPDSERGADAGVSRGSAEPSALESEPVPGSEHGSDAGSDGGSEHGS
ncbi:MAG: hypothetical protein WEB88_11125, partial [Gemmatimonadota bacterium]